MRSGELIESARGRLPVGSPATEACGMAEAVVVDRGVGDLATSGAIVQTVVMPGTPRPTAPCSRQCYAISKLISPHSGPR